MSHAVSRPMTVDEFLAWENQQALKHEFNGFEIVAMVGGTLEHAVIQRNLARFIGAALDGRPCQFYGSDAKIVVAGSVRYPDGVVTCTQPAPRSTVAPEPLVVFEVLSDSTARIDRTEKMDEYQATASVQRYVMLEQTRVMATVFARELGFAREFGNWVGRVLHAGDDLAMPEIGISVPLADLYRDVALDRPG